MRYLIILIVVVCSASGHSWAGGLYLTEISSAEVGLASAGWAARADDAGTVFSNPAGMTRLSGKELYAGLQPMYIDLEFTPNGNTTVPGGGSDASDWLAAGNIYYVQSVTDDLKFGLGLLGYFGLSIDYGNQWAGRYHATEVGLQGLTFTPALAYKVNNWLSLGAGITFMYAIYDSKSAVNNPDSTDGLVSFEDEDIAIGANLGILVELSDTTRLGLQYLSESDLNLKDQPSFTGLGPTLSAILGAAGLLDADLNLGMTNPQSLMFSVVHEVSDDWTIMTNVGWQDWSEFGKVGIEVSLLPLVSLSVDSNYDDSWHAALGAQYKISRAWLLSFGIAYDSSIVDDENRTVDMALDDTWRFGLGASYNLRENLELSCAYEIMWTGDMSVDQENGPLAGRIAGEYDDVRTHFINVGLKWRF